MITPRTTTIFSPQLASPRQVSRVSSPPLPPAATPIHRDRLSRALLSRQRNCRVVDFSFRGARGADSGTRRSSARRAPHTQAIERFPSSSASPPRASPPPPRAPTASGPSSSTTTSACITSAKYTGAGAAHTARARERCARRALGHREFMGELTAQVVQLQDRVNATNSLVFVSGLAVRELGNLTQAVSSPMKWPTHRRW